MDELADRIVLRSGDEVPPYLRRALQVSVLKRLEQTRTLLLVLGEKTAHHLVDSTVEGLERVWAQKTDGGRDS